MKVIITSRAVYPLHGYGGMEKYVYYLSKYLVKQGINVEIVSSSDNKKRKEEVIDGIKYTIIPPQVNQRRLSHLWYHLFVINLAKYLKKKEFAVLHSYGITSYAYLHLKKRASTIVQAFDFEPFILEKKYLKATYNEIFMKNPLRYCITHCDAIALYGEYQIDEIIKLFNIDRNRVFFLPVGVDISSIIKTLEVKKLSRENLGLKDKDFVLISVNRFDSHKGINYLVDAFNLIKQEIDNAKLILIGAGSEEERIKKQIEDYKLTDSVIHLKNVPEDLLYNYYALSDIYVSPTLFEYFITSVMEAMACGLPIVSTGQEFIVESGVNGYVVPKRNAKEMAEAVLKIYDGNKVKTMGNASQQIIKKYDWNIIAKNAIKKYEKLIKEG